MGWLTLVPAVVALLVVFWQKEVILALLLAILASEILLHFTSPEVTQSVLTAPVATIERIVAVFESAGNSRLLIFSLLVGALLTLMRYSGGVSAVVAFLINRGIARSARQSSFLTFFTGIVIFIESNLSVLIAGILSRGLFDKFKMSRARLAYIIDSTSAPVCILLLLNGWGAYVLGLLDNYQLSQSSVSILIATIPLNFYAIFTMLLVLFTVYTGKVYGPLKHAEKRMNKLDTETNVETSVPATKIRYMIVPLVTMVVSMVGFMLWTGNGQITNGSGSKSALYATVSACLVAYLLMLFNGQFKHKKLMEISFKGMSELLPLVSIMLLSFALGASLRDLGTGEFISGLVAENVSLAFIPALLFLAGALISFTTGTSWGTFAILIPIGIPMVQNLGLNPALVLAAILGGGVFGDHCSPISDTTAVTSVASGCDLLEHVKTQLPYALSTGGLSVVAYLLAGWLWI